MINIILAFITLLEFTTLALLKGRFIQAFTPERAQALETGHVQGNIAITVN